MHLEPTILEPFSDSCRQARCCATGVKPHVNGEELQREQEGSVVLHHEIGHREAIKAARDALAVGDRVEWTRSSGSSSNMTFTQQRGTILELEDTVAVVKLRNGHKRRMHVTRLHKTGSGPNQLSRALGVGDVS